MNFQPSNQHMPLLYEGSYKRWHMLFSYFLMAKNSQKVRLIVIVQHARSKIRALKFALLPNPCSTKWHTIVTTQKP